MIVGLNIHRDHKQSIRDRYSYQTTKPLKCKHYLENSQVGFIFQQFLHHLCVALVTRLEQWSGSVLMCNTTRFIH